MDALETLREIWKRYNRAVIVKDRLGVPHTILGMSPTGNFIGRKSGKTSTSEYAPDDRVWFVAGSW